MKVEQLYTNCLSEAAYFISDGKEAAVIDPVRDIQQYLDKAEQEGVVIKYVFETHFHADFVSGHIDLAKQTGATIVYGPGAKGRFKFHESRDGEEFKLGNLTLRVMHTPGHTVESSCYLLLNEEGNPYCVFTGDTLFVGDVGRPDLFSGELSKEELAGMLFVSLKKLSSLPDEVIVYPAHGPGSPCGKSLGKETFSSIGEQKETNYALKAKSAKEFVQLVSEGLNLAPEYFSRMAQLNTKMVDPIEEVIKKSFVPLSVEQTVEESKEEAWLLDVRVPTEFTTEFIPNSVNIGLNGRFADFAGRVLPYDKPLIIIANNGKEEEAITRLARVGFQNVIGYLDGGLNAWKEAGKPTDMIIDVTAEELALDIPFDKKLAVIDVRSQSEFKDGHIRGAQSIPLDTFTDTIVMAQFDDSKNMYVHCLGGYRSVIACSLLKRQGFHNLRNVLGGWRQIIKEQEISLVLPNETTEE